MVSVVDKVGVLVVVVVNVVVVIVIVEVVTVIVDGVSSSNVRVVCIGSLVVLLSG